MEKLLKLTPAFKDYLWGGTNLKTRYSKKSDLDIVAESWELSCHKDGPSTVANGSFAGKSLESFIDANPKSMGSHGMGRDKFPILAKFIDAKQSLSVQVHPDDDYAQKIENEFGKNEMWFVLDAEPDSALIFGFAYGVTKEQYQKAMENGTVIDTLRTVPVKKGDYFFIPAGMMHGIGAGITIAEIQQNSNATYRVYDYDRKDANGNYRELHTEKALDVLRFDALPKAEIVRGSCDNLNGNRIVPLTNSQYFNTNFVNCDGSMEFGVMGRSFHHVMVLEGNGEVISGNEKITVTKGDSVFISAEADFYSLNGAFTCLQTYL